jgi:hypothetical protein
MIVAALLRQRPRNQITHITTGGSLQHLVLIMAPEARVPAWKRLGLKLVGSKRQAEEAFTDENALQRTADSTTDSKMDGKSQVSKKRKSVSFSAVSKSKDGSTSQHLLDDFVNSQTGVDGQFTPEEASLFTTKAQSRPKRPKAEPQLKGKKSKTRKQSSNAEQPSTPAYVDYLVQFYTDKERWKFNKVRQTQLLKHIFDPNAPLSEHMDAVKAYVEGLRGTEARKRLRTTALEIAELSDDAKETLRKELLDVKVHMREAEDIKDANRPVGRTKLAVRERALQILIALDYGVSVKVVPHIDLFEEAMENPDLANTNRLSTKVIEVNTPDGPVIESKRVRTRVISTGHPDEDVESVSSVDSIPTADNATSTSSSESSEESSSESEEESSEEESSDGEDSTAAAEENRGWG